LRPSCPSPCLAGSSSGDLAHAFPHVKSLHFPRLLENESRPNMREQIKIWKTTAKFPVTLTFDCSRTPKRGESKRTGTLKPINPDRLQERLASEGRGRLQRPEGLRAEIARLKVERAKQPAAPAADPAAIEATQARQSLDVLRNLIGESIKNFCASVTDTLSVLTPDLQIPDGIQSRPPTGWTVPSPTRRPLPSRAIAITCGER
jgi:hypothetical protein